MLNHKIIFHNIKKIIFAVLVELCPKFEDENVSEKFLARI
jgi:hypothetical protein